MKVVLDTGILGQICHPNTEENKSIHEWFASLLDNGDTEVYIPEIVDYELRRKLLHMIASNRGGKKSLDRLNDLVSNLDYIKITTEIMRNAAALWAEARSKGIASADEKNIDGDIIIAVQAKSVDGLVVTSNSKHLSKYVEARNWTELAS